MTTFDLAPLYRSTVGFDHLASLFDSLTGERNQPSWPPYNIESVDDDKYRITMAVAGFSEEEIDVVAENNTLTVSAEKGDKDASRNYLYRGIAERNFKRQFRLENHVKVTGATLENGLLHIALEREVPEAMKPRRIAINGNQQERAQNEAQEAQKERLLKSA